MDTQTQKKQTPEIHTQAEQTQKEQIKKARDKAYNDYVKEVTPTHSCPLNMLRAFTAGGVICVIGQLISDFYTSLHLTEDVVSGYTTLTLILISVILTCLNLVGPITKFAGAGYLVPITGFANSVASCALEFKAEGQVFGIGASIFKIAGPVILYGVFTSWILGLLYWLVG